MKAWEPGQSPGQRSEARLTRSEEGAASSATGQLPQPANGHAPGLDAASYPPATVTQQPLVTRRRQVLVDGSEPGLAVAQNGHSPVPAHTEELSLPAVAVMPEPEPARPRRLTSNWLWRTRGFWLGGAGLLLAYNGQRLLTVDHQVVLSIRWYAVGIIVMLLAWAGTYKNTSSLVVEIVSRVTGQAPPLPLPPPAPAPDAHLEARTTLPVRVRPVVQTVAPTTRTRPLAAVRARYSALVSRFPALRAWPRYLIGFLALGLNLYSAGRIRADYFSVVGSLGWVASLILLLASFIGERRRTVESVDVGTPDIESRDSIAISRWVEVAIVLGIVLLAFFLRVYHLGDWSTGMHGDEGETGMNAISILEGNRVSPFATGWFSHPNFSFWGIALTMQVVGVSLFGLRFLSTLLGTLVMVPFYLLVRMWFGVRAAIIATVLFAVMDISIYFGKLGLNNIQTPVFLVVGFFFLVRGLRTLRTTDFILAGYGFMLTLYFYFAGRLTPFIVAALIAYLFVLLPLARVPGAYFTLRRTVPTLSRLRSLATALGRQFRPVLGYIRPVLFLVIGGVCMASPWFVYYEANQDLMNSRSNDKYIFSGQNEAAMASQYNIAHGPLYIGLRMPTGEDIYPLLPIVFEKTPLSVHVAPDGFLARVAWSQTTTTLSLFTYRADASSFYTFTGAPAAKPLEATLLILGLAFALWRWRDGRMGMLSIWFWLTLIAGGVLTIDAPYLPRLVGLVPAVAILIAIPVNKFLAEMQGALTGFRARVRWQRARFYAVRALTAMLAVGLLVYSGLQNYSDFYNHYMAAYPDRDSVGAATFVRQMSNEVLGEGRPQPMFYQLGMHVIYWGYGVNRFLNHGIPGDDMINPANLLPVTNNDNRDVVFFAWPFDSQYLSIFETYYPGGELADFSYGPPGQAGTIFTYYRVKKEQIEARRGSLATYTPASGGSISRNEGGLGTSVAPPVGLAYPTQARWKGDVYAPQMGKYHLGIDTNGPGSLRVDGTQVLTTTAATMHAETDLVLAKGLHDVTLTGTLSSAGSKVAVAWSSGGTNLTAIPHEYLWNGPGKGLYGEIRPLTTGDPTQPTQAGAGSLITARVDGFLGFRHTPDAIVQGAFEGTWSGTLTITQTGQYNFDVYSNGSSAVYVDDQLVEHNVANGSATQAAGQIQLDPGPHKFMLRYDWEGGTGYLEAYWTPPGGQHVLIGPDVLHTDGGVISPSALASAPPQVQVQPPAAGTTQPATVIQPKLVAGADAGLQKPRGLAVDAQGNMYIGDRGNHRIVVLSPDGKVLHSWGKAAPTPAPQGQGQTPGATPGPGEFAEINDVAVGPDGTVYVFDSSLRLQAFSENGDFIGEYPAAWLGLYGANGIAVGPPTSPSSPAAYSIYIAATGQNRIVEVPSITSMKGKIEGAKAGENPILGEERSIEGPAGDKLEQPVDVVVDPSSPNTLYTIDLKDRIVQFKRTPAGSGATPGPGNPTPSGQSSNAGSGWQVAQSWAVPVGRADGGSRLGMSVDGKQIYMSDPDRARVAVLDIASGNVGYFGTLGGDPGDFKMPSGIAVGPDSSIYVLDRDSTNVQLFPANLVKKP